MGNNYRVIYCSTVWGSMGKGLSNKVKKFQNIGWLELLLVQAIRHEIQGYLVSIGRICIKGFKNLATFMVNYECSST